jgi:nicotinamidase-related amidase
MLKNRSVYCLAIVLLVAGGPAAETQVPSPSPGRELILTTRYFRTRPIDRQGYETETFRLDPRKTAIVALHLWDIGSEGGPAVDRNYFVGMGIEATTREADRIVRDVIKPTVDAARRAGVLVCHVTHEWIGRRDPRAQKLADAEARETSITVSPGGPSPGYEAVPGWRKRIEERAYGEDFLNKSPLARMNESRAIDVRPGEPYVYQTDLLRGILKERGIENIIYMGFATDVCVLRAGGGIEAMAAESYRVFLVRDATIGVEFLDTFKERRSTEYAIRYFEVNFGDTLLSADFLRACPAGK